MQRRAVRRGKLSVFSYFIIFVLIIGITAVTLKELNINSPIGEVLYQKDIATNTQTENRYYINKIKKDFGIVVEYGENEKNILNSVNANVQEDEFVVNNNLKII